MILLSATNQQEDTMAKAKVGVKTNIQGCGCHTLPKRRKRSHVRTYTCPTHCLYR